MTSEGRLTAEERSEAILREATREFAAYGFHGASTSTMARHLGISQPYIFKLFGTKKELFLATLERVYERVERAFRDAAERARREGRYPLQIMGDAYIQMLNERADLQLMLQGFATAGEPDVQAFVRRRYTEIFELVQQVSGASMEECRAFMATGLLLTVTAVADLSQEAFWPEYVSR